MQPNEDAAHVYYACGERDFIKEFALKKDNRQDTEMFAQHGYSEESLKLIEQRIIFSLKNHDDIVIIPKPEDVCNLEEGGYLVLFNTLPDTEAGNQLFQKSCTNYINAVKNGKVNATSVIPVTLHNEPSKHDIEWITSIMLSAKYVRVVLNTDSDKLYRIIHQIALKHNIEVVSVIQHKQQIAGVPIVKNY